MCKQKLLLQLDSLLKKINDDEIGFHLSKLPQLTESVNKAIEAREDLKVIIGATPIQTIRDNHTHHGSFINSSLKIKDAETIYDTFLWAYNTYSKKGVGFRYFFLELTAWKEALIQTEQAKFSGLIAFYQFFINQHAHFVQLTAANSLTQNSSLISSENHAVLHEVITALLKPSLNNAKQIAADFIKNDADIRTFWLGIIMPALYQVGELWANSKITVGEEHTATSICQLIMSSHYGEVIKHVQDNPTTVAITSPKELHQVGLRMLSDILELHGYPVEFLEANASIDDILQAIEQENADLLIISTTLKGNLPAAKEMIKQIRDRSNTPVFKIAVGGQAFEQSNKLKDYVNADYVLHNIEDIINLRKELKYAD